MLERICKTCRSWDFGDMGVGVCHAAVGFPGGLFEAVADDEGPAELRTRADFGCNQWDEAPRANKDTPNG